MKSIVIGCDNAAVSMKDMLKEYLKAKGLAVEDMGCNSEKDPTNYPHLARACL